MNLALKQYSEGDKDNFEDIAESIIIVRNHLDLLAKLFHTFDNSKYFKGTTIQQLNTLNLAAEYVQQTKEFETRFMGLVKRLKAAYDICAGSEQLTQVRKRLHPFLFGSSFHCFQTHQRQCTRHSTNERQSSGNDKRCFAK
jgi:type I restriction enzyme R subunit